jgi:hypothetical protein
MQPFENDLDLINNIKNNNCADDSIRALELKHSGICHQMIKKYYSAFLEKGIDPNKCLSPIVTVIRKSGQPLFRFYTT